MYHIVFILLTASLVFLGWHLVHCTPRVLSMFLSPKVSFGIGFTLFIFGLFLAFAAAVINQNADGVLACLVQVFVGLWFMLAGSSAQRGSYEDERMLKRLFAMLITMIGVIVGTMYVPDLRIVAVFNLLMITTCFWIITNYFEVLDGKRR